MAEVVTVNVSPSALYATLAVPSVGIVFGWIVTSTKVLGAKLPEAPVVPTVPFTV